MITKYLPGSMVVELVVRSNNLVVLELIPKSRQARIVNELYSIRNRQVVEYLIEQRHLGLLGHLATVTTFEYQAWMMPVALRSGSIEVVEFMLRMDIPMPPDPIGYVVVGTSGGSSSSGQQSLLNYLTALGYQPTEQSIVTAVKAGRLDVVQQLFTMGARANEEAALVAAGHGHLSIIKYLESLDVRGVRWSMMGVAAFNGHFEVVKYLYNSGAMIDFRVAEAAIRGKHLEVIKYLYQRGPEVLRVYRTMILELGNLEVAQRVMRETRPTPSDLKNVFVSGNTDLVQYLLQTGTPPPPEVYYSPNLDLVQHYYETLKLPLSRSMVDDAINHDDATILEWVLDQNTKLTNEQVNEVVISSRSRILELLIRRRYPLPIEALKNAIGWSVPDLDELIQLLIDTHTPSAVVTSTWYEVLLLGTVASGHYQAVRFLLDRRAELVNTPIDHHLAAKLVCEAAIHGHLSLLRYLNELTSHWPSLRDSQRAIHGGHFNVIKFLVHLHGIQVGVLTEMLEVAAQTGYFTIVKYLLGLGIRPTQQAINLAISNGHMVIVQLFHEQYYVPLQQTALTDAIRRDHLSVVEYVLPRLGLRIDSDNAEWFDELVRVVHSGNRNDIAQFSTANIYLGREIIRTELKGHRAVANLIRRLMSLMK